MIMLFFVFCIGILLGAFVTCAAQIYLFRRLDIIIAPDRDKAHGCCKRVMVSTDIEKRMEPLRGGKFSKGRHHENAPMTKRPESTQNKSNADIWGPNVSTIKPIDPGRIKIFDSSSKTSEFDPKKWENE